MKYAEQLEDLVAALRVCWYLSRALRLGLLHLRHPTFHTPPASFPETLGEPDSAKGIAQMCFPRAASVFQL